MCFLLFRHQLMRFWSSDQKVIEAGAKILVCAAFYQVFHAARIIYSGSLRGAGDTLWLALISAVGAALILGFGGWLIVKIFPQVGYMGPWLMAAVSIAGVGLANRWRFKSNRWMEIDLFRRPPIAVPAQNGAPVE